MTLPSDPGVRYWFTDTWPHTELDGTLPPDQLAQTAIAASPALQALTALPSHP